MNEPADAACIAASERIRGPLQFYDQWPTEFPWLCFEGGKMFCTVCMSQDSTSGQFVNGSTSFHKKSLIKHAERYSSQQFRTFSFFIMLIIGSVQHKSCMHILSGHTSAEQAQMSQLALLVRNAHAIANW